MILLKSDKMNKSRVLLIGCIISLINFWIWRIMEANPFLGISLVILNLLLIYLILVRMNKKLLLFSLIIILLISYQSVITGFDKNLIKLDPSLEKKIGERHGYYAINLGSLFQNKFILRFYRDVYPHFNIFVSNVYNNLSPNLYFFANHPREREKVEEFVKYSPFLIIPFIVGLSSLILNVNYHILVYSVYVILFMGLIKQTYYFGPVLFFPLINLSITIGILKMFSFFRK